MLRKQPSFKPKLHYFRFSKKTCPNSKMNSNRLNKNFLSAKKSMNNWGKSNNNFRIKSKISNPNCNKSNKNNLKINKEINNSIKYSNLKI